MFAASSSRPGDLEPLLKQGREDILKLLHIVFRIGIQYSTSHTNVTLVAAQVDQIVQRASGVIAGGQPLRLPSPRHWVRLPLLRDSSAQVAVDFDFELGLGIRLNCFGLAIFFLPFSVRLPPVPSHGAASPYYVTAAGNARPKPHPQVSTPGLR